jgi:translation initiation factor 1
MKLNSLSDLEKLLPHPAQVPSSGGKKKHDGKSATVHISLDTKGRKGKTVTLVSALQHNPDTMRDIARMLKEHCGTGGTVKDRTIELQGDQRVRAKAFLETLNYVVK